MTTRRKPPRPPLHDRGRPALGDDFHDASLAAKIRLLADELGRAVDAADVYRLAMRRNLFTQAQLGRFGRRAGTEYIRRCITEYSAETGGPDRISVPWTGGAQLYIKEILATTAESRESYVALCKGALADVGEIRRRWQRHIERFGPEGMPPAPQIDLGI